MIIFFFITIAITLAGLVIIKYGDRYSDSRVFGLILTVIGAAVCVGSLIAIPANQYAINEEIAKLEAFRSTIQTARAANEPIERTAFLLKIAEWNEKLAEWKFNNENLEDWWIPDEVQDIEPIK